MTSTDIIIILGTRPEIIKLSPVIRECESQGIPYEVIHTGQHYSENLDTVFFDQLSLPAPKYNLGIGSGSHGMQTGEMLKGVEEILLEENPESVLVQGDTNSVAAGALGACKLDVTLGHIEAGLRSFDRDMPEEMNRVVADHVSDILFAPTTESADHLRTEGIPESRIEITGNTIVDAVYHNKKIAEKESEIQSTLGIDDDFVLMTSHRAENVDNATTFDSILTGAAKAGELLDTEVLYPIHPRARKNLDEFDLEIPDRIRLLEPCDYLDFLLLEMSASIILTDSGGVQEEACILEVPCITTRESTERPETVDVGANKVVGTEHTAIVESVKQMMEKRNEWENPYGDGTASKQILQALGYPQRGVGQ